MKSADERIGLEAIDGNCTILERGARRNDAPSVESDAPDASVGRSPVSADGEGGSASVSETTLHAAGPPKPRFLVDEHSEKVWDVVLALTTELAATRARLDALERVLTQRGSLPPGAVEEWLPDVDDGVERTRDLQAYMQRIFETLGRD